MNEFVAAAFFGSFVEKLDLFIDQRVTSLIGEK
jgi:hypothetical protein